MRQLILVTGFCGVLLSNMAFAKGEPEWKLMGKVYSGKHAVAINSIALGAVNVDVGTHLERLTLLSGEGHTGKKVASGLLAGGLTLMGAGAGIDTAAREPIEEHLTIDDTKKIAAEVAELVAEHFKKMSDIKIIAGEEITKTEWFAGLGGAMEVDKKKRVYSEGRWSPEYYFGYYSTPAGAYGYRGASKFSFGDNTFSPVIRKNLGVSTTAVVNVFLVNTRKEYRALEMSVNLYGLSWDGQKGADQPVMMLTLQNPGGLSAPITNAKDNYAAWLALKPKFEQQLDALVQKIHDSIPAIAP